ncbi:PEPxxWA-CTERM sorting domain-containing protein [Phenylobacterium sp.]|uniref:PEPxxWA-CTERM sorting domain-containing protein n=1 Tax=Phenylobacterium sp. TaxID=1871053 RepID=UPI00286B6C41|nr:PEPxxWA-CTERM sorting domain-containing protein [Phenylobacterium sp.]
MKLTSVLAGAALAAGLVAALPMSAAADTTAFNSTPADTWFYGTGNGYAPANTEVLSTTAGDQLYLRLHNTFLPALASVGNVYSFATSAGQQVSFDWGFDLHSGFDAPLSALITLTNLAGGSFSYNPLALGNDNAIGFGSTQNSFRLNWPPTLNFKPAIDGTYKVNLTLTGLDGGTKSLDAVAKLGKGFTAGVPEPSTWAMMLVGFGGLGAVLRANRRRPVAA